LGRLADEALGMSAVGGVENGTTPFDRFRSQTIMNHSRRKKAQSGMAMLFVMLRGVSKLLTRAVSGACTGVEAEARIVRPRTVRIR